MVSKSTIEKIEKIYYKIVVLVGIPVYIFIFALFSMPYWAPDKFVEFVASNPEESLREAWSSGVIFGVFVMALTMALFQDFVLPFLKKHGWLK